MPITIKYTYKFKKQVIYMVDGGVVNTKCFSHPLCTSHPQFPPVNLGLEGSNSKCSMGII